MYKIFKIMRASLTHCTSYYSCFVQTSVDSFQMSLKEDKENLMKKPSRIPAKAVKSSSVTSNIRAPLSSNKSKPLTRSCSNQSLDKWSDPLIFQQLFFMNVNISTTLGYCNSACNMADCSRFTIAIIVYNWFSSYVADCHVCTLCFFWLVTGLALFLENLEKSKEF